MILDLYDIGKAVCEGQSELTELVQEISKFYLKTKKGEALPSYQVQALVFDLDEGRVYAPPTDALDETPEQLWRLGAVRFSAPRAKKHYPAVIYPKNSSQFEVGLFDADGEAGDLAKWAGTEADADLLTVLDKIASLHGAYRTFLGDKDLGSVLSDKSTKGFPIVLLYAAISWEEKGWKEKPLAEIGNFQALYKNSRTGGDEGASVAERCYFTNALEENVTAPDSTNRYNLNKVFVTTTYNYAPGFDKNAYASNYQISPAVFSVLEAGSEYLLRSGKLSIEIAGVNHVCIPKVIDPTGKAELDSDFIDDIKNVNLSLFTYNGFEGIANALKFVAEGESPFSLTFIAYESDGNSTKIINTIREVDNFRFYHIMQELTYVNRLFAAWRGERNINLYAFFENLPIIKDLKRNIGLELLGNLLEGRKVREELLFQYCAETLNCHTFSRYKLYDYPKGLPSTDNTWKYAKTITHFSALRLMLYRSKQLENGSLRNNELLYATTEDLLVTNKFDTMENNHQTYFDRLGYTPRQQALFYLGRSLNQVAYAQAKKQNSRSILDAVDFTGMNKRKLEGLAIAIMEKAKVYRRENSKQTVFDDIQFNLNKFFAGFDSTNWDSEITYSEDQLLEKPISAKGAVFFIMAGYTYGAQLKEKTTESTPLTDEETENQ